MPRSPGYELLEIRDPAQSRETVRPRPSPFTLIMLENVTFKHPPPRPSREGHPGLPYLLPTLSLSLWARGTSHPRPLHGVWRRAWDRPGLPAFLLPGSQGQSVNTLMGGEIPR